MRTRIPAVFVLSLLAFGPSLATAQTRQITVVFKSATLPPDASAIVEAAGGKVVAEVPEIGVIEARGPARSLEILSRDPRILAATPALEFRLPPAVAAVVEPEPAAVDVGTADLYALYQWDIKQVTESGASFSVGTGSHQTVVGIVDTGVSTWHPALAANLLGGRNFTPDGPGGVVVPTDIEDRNGHGSHVAGAIAGNGRILGVGPDLGIRAYRVFGAEGGASTLRIVAAIVAAVNDQVDVISMSVMGYDAMAIGHWTDRETGVVHRFKDVADFLAYRRAVQYATGHGVVVVAAAGNDSVNLANPTVVTAYLNAEYGRDGYYFQGASREVPGTIAGVLTVSATGPDLTPASYTNFGPGAIDVSAPGGDVTRYPAAGWYTDMCLSAHRGMGYAWMAGTSMAAPKVSAVAALIIDQIRAAGGRVNPAQVVSRIQQAGVDLGRKGYDPYYGQGMVDALRALTWSTSRRDSVGAAEGRKPFPSDPRRPNMDTTGLDLTGRWQD